MMSGKIIVVCMYSGRTPDSGVVSSVNYSGRALGIHAGMPIIQAKKRAPPRDSIFLPADREYYAEVSAQIDSVIRGFIDRLSQASIDEWNGEDKDATEKAPVLKGMILQATGLRCSIGVAPSPLGAKMAASMSKPDGLLVFDEILQRSFIENSEVEKVPGIGPKTASALNQLGITKVKDLGKADPVVLSEIFGKKTGSWLIDLGAARYPNALQEEKEQEEVSRIGTLKEKTRDPYIIILKLEELEKDAKQWLMENKKSYSTMGVIFITDDMRTHTRSISFKKPKAWSEGAAKDMEALVKQFLDEDKHDIRRIGIRFGNFLDLGKQTTLF